MGGTCTCLNGTSYLVGALDTECEKLACYGKNAVSSMKDIQTHDEKYRTAKKNAECVCKNGNTYNVGYD